MLAPRRLENFADTGASACLGGATAFAAYAVLNPVLAQSLAVTCAAAIAAFAYWLSRTMLGAIPAPARASVAAAPLAELWLDEVFVSEPPDPADDARVVRLFDPSAMPRESMGNGSQLANNDLPSGATPDASAALREALNQLRRSLRQA